ncbi:aspartyl asparaginyl beta-hydroxylase family protein [Stylonychia lemnae]|uniref:Aspartyl asparaginyl beta-hydroxylase family protein n=1 Tax=Stylonychia lemnae TaxID=5949 RepID=A0A078AP94_STYLE|nr:aspartyl asparaginyl beta-hydroxylase family protein [Stylonychia lemnae]|eukprot:CDW82783.1 aspartyl asparaginyl beta-hydroxylase family protein [Stylonychia lemnae]
MFINDQQSGCKNIIPGLRGIPLWRTDEFPWIKELEQHSDTIKQELLLIFDGKQFKPNGLILRALQQDIEQSDQESEDLTDHFWNSYQLFSPVLDLTQEQLRIPKTTNILRSVIKNQKEKAAFSLSVEKFRQEPHHGDQNYILRFVYPIMGGEGTQIKVGDEYKYYQEGQMFVVDDSFLHQVIDEGDDVRIQLILDIWHPDLNDEEIKILEIMDRAFERLKLLQSFSYYQIPLNNELQELQNRIDELDHN